MNDEVVGGNAPIIDDGAAILSLGDSGYVCVAIRPDGESQWWIVVPGGDRTTVVMPAHEQLGPLPGAVMARVLRCGQRCANGHPCRRSVSRVGMHCAHHRRAGVTS